MSEDKIHLLDVEVMYYRLELKTSETGWNKPNVEVTATCVFCKTLVRMDTHLKIKSHQDSCEMNPNRTYLKCEFDGCEEQFPETEAGKIDIYKHAMTCKCNPTYQEALKLAVNNTVICVSNSGMDGYYVQKRVDQPECPEEDHEPNNWYDCHICYENHQGDAEFWYSQIDGECRFRHRDLDQNPSWEITGGDGTYSVEGEKNLVPADGNVKWRGFKVEVLADWMYQSKAETKFCHCHNNVVRWLQQKYQKMQLKKMLPGRSRPMNKPTFSKGNKFSGTVTATLCRTNKQDTPTIFALESPDKETRIFFYHGKQIHVGNELTVCLDKDLTDYVYKNGTLVKAGLNSIRKFTGIIPTDNITHDDRRRLFNDNSTAIVTDTSSSVIIWALLVGIGLAVMAYMYYKSMPVDSENEEDLGPEDQV